MTILTTIAFITSVLLSANTALAASVANPHFTPMSLSPEPASVNLSYEVAGVYWLPDYLKGNISRGSEDPGGGDIDTGCGIYGLFDNCEPPRQAGGVVYPVSGLKCFKGCSCPPAYQYNVSNCKFRELAAAISVPNAVVKRSLLLTAAIVSFRRKCQEKAAEANTRVAFVRKVSVRKCVLAEAIRIKSNRAASEGWDVFVAIVTNVLV